jgi:hypothetical protein
MPNFSPVPDYKMPDCVSLVRYRTCSGNVSFFQSGTGLFGCRTVRHSGIYTHKQEHAHEHALANAHKPMMCGMNMDRNMDVQHGHEHGHGHAPGTWTCTRDMDMHQGHGDGQAPWMPECRNADKKFSPASLVFS